MKKIAIITLVGNNNYGNRLQNYALVKAIRKQGDYEISTIWYNPWNKTIKDFFKKDIFSFMYGLNNYQDFRRKTSLIQRFEKEETISVYDFLE